MRYILNKDGRERCGVKVDRAADARAIALRRRMIEDMTIRKLAPKTQRDYVQRIKNFRYVPWPSPDTASFEDMRHYQLHLAVAGAGVPTLNQSTSTMRFFFWAMLGRGGIVNNTQFVHEPCKLPVVLGTKEMARFLDAAPGLNYKAALSAAYGAADCAYPKWRCPTSTASAW
jgi:integrase/recombinase XerD